MTSDSKIRSGDASNTKPGMVAEDLAAHFLTQQGLSIVARNYRCRFGEIDLIAKDGDTLVFVEVRLRRTSAFGGAIGSIDRAKQKKLTMTARHYLSRLRVEPACRFDALLLDALDARRIEWLRDIIG